MIRFFCHTCHDVDEEPARERSRVALRYAEALVALGQDLRVISVEPSLLQPIRQKRGGRWVFVPHPWSALERLFRTPIGIEYTNVVVATEPWWWFRYYTVGVKNVLITHELPDLAEAQRAAVPRLARDAAGVKKEVVNGKLVEFEVMELHETPSPVRVATEYASIVVPTPELADAWRTAGARQVVVVGMDLAARAKDLLEALGVA